MTALFPGPSVGAPPGAASYFHQAGITAGATVKAGVGSLRGVTINNSTASTLTLYDSLTATGSVIGIIATTGPVSLLYDIQFNIGLFIVNSAASDVTIAYA
jgi:hypothetical protein